MPSENLPTMDFVTTGFSGRAYGEWSQYEYAKVLEHHWRSYNVSFDNIYYGGDLVSTFLKTDRGNIRKYNSVDIEDFEDLLE